MTLWNNDLTDEFKKLINLENVERTIFGFLCFDHVETDYFDEETDVLLGYVFADLISLYIFSRLVYVEISKTFGNVEKHLTDAKKTIEAERLEAVWKSIPGIRDISEYLTFEPKKTRRNSLFPMDEDLIRYVKAQHNETLTMLVPR
ncbi:MAG: hypothetical protein K8R75_03825 [Deltaproteobacteria bacterium]|nr:hypothetical protein [Deltaproteobacteria bacterium]